jgi:iron complex outermembrane recepter protein
VVKGPPSPVFGMGKIGGYTNVTPKSGRAKLGGYLPSATGFAQAIAGSYERSEWSFGVGGPLGLKSKQGGYYVYGLLEDSESFTRDVPFEQKIGQIAVSVDNFVGPFRLDVGSAYQFAKTAGALTTRVTQDLIDNGRYVRGIPLANLDANGNGSLGFLEYSRLSPVRGNLSAANQPLSQRFNWQRDSAGNFRPLSEFQSVAGIPESMYNYLVTSCGGSATASPTGCADPTGLLRAQGIGGPRPTSGFVPVGFVLDPRTVGYDTLDLHRAGAFERELEGTFVLGFADLVYDANPDFTVKNQLFFDSMDQFKISQQPSGGKQDVYAFEDKVTVTRRLTKLPDWLRVNSLGSINFRETKSTGYRYGGDFGSTRTDVMYGTGDMMPNTTFIHAFENSDINADGAPWTSDYETKYWESGLGLMFDVDVFTKTNVILGGRYDYSKAKNTDFASFNPAAGTSANPGRPTTEASAEGSDSGTSWSVSLSHQLPFGIRPYVTLAEASLALDSNNNSLDNATITAGHIGSAELKEAGIKGAFLGGKLQFSTAVYRQTRTDVARSDDPTIGAEVSSTETEGWETEIKVAPMSNLYVSLYGLTQKSTYLFNNGGNILVDARTLGFQDVVDPVTGAVIYPAEAFLYGGRAFLTLPAGLSEYTEKQGNPATQLGLTAAYQMKNGLGFTLSANHLSSTKSGRLQLLELPEATTANLGITYNLASWHLKFDVFNLTDERYFRARTGDTLSDAMVSVVPDRRYQFTARLSF